MVAIDGSKFKASNGRDLNYTTGKIDKRQQQIEESVQRYLDLIETADRTSPTGFAVKTDRLYEKIALLRLQMRELAQIRKQLEKQPDKQLSMTDPDARSMTTSGRGSEIVGYNVQAAVDTKHHLVVEHEVTNIGNHHGQLSRMALAAKKGDGRIESESCSGSGLLQRAGDKSVRSERNPRVRPQATHLCVTEERSVHQSRLCVRGKKRRVSMSCW